MYIYFQAELAIVKLYELTGEMLRAYFQKICNAITRGSKQNKILILDYKTLMRSLSQKMK